ncbi:serine/threonine receptor-like kinase NFP [Impatiens glandulifera]|uniref:serine/threonine receptor-like kinase NFP n=1 Tax=Impatiens glandulifera TaxID=253017 RepID=UPI001FB17FDC|nr:serine/threonine receptor-like kinase NFP [Impatiens glandulifera]
MKIKLDSISSLTLIIFLYSIQIPSAETCSSSESHYPCQTYVFYRAMATEFLDLASIGDLFSTSRVMIANPSNILSPSTPLIPNQPLFVPIACSCNRINGGAGNTSLSYANITYKIKKGDTFFLGSTIYFQNLTNDQSVQLVNPNLIPTDLQIGTLVVFPILCKCLNPNSYLISYVFQPSDSISSLALKFGSTSKSIVDINGDELQPFDTIFIPVSRLPRLPQPIFAHQSSRSYKQRSTIIGLEIGLGITGFLLASVIGLWGYREFVIMKKRKGSSDEEIHHLIRGVKGINMKEEEEVNLMADISQCLDKCKMFRIEELREATDGFDSRLLIQGSVYKGCIDGVLYSIKKMGWNAFEELQILHRVNHGNLVGIEGFCMDPEETGCYIVHEFVENGSLHSWLHGSANRRHNLCWKTRLRIAIDVANGLQYIHEHTRPQVIHKDIKSSNILLDSNMRAKIANFGLARSGCNALTVHVNSTQGYAPPEYLKDGLISTKTDVFSFGVVLAELVSGKEAAMGEGGNSMLWKMAGMMMEGKEEERRKRVSEWMDDAILKQSDWSIENVMNVIVIAIACLRKEPSKRPSMMEIVYALCKTSEDMFFDVSEDGPSPRALNAR